MNTNNSIFRLSPLILSIITIIVIIGSVFSNAAITKIQIVEMQKQLLEIKTNVKVLEAQRDVRDLAIIVQRMDLAIARMEVIIQQQEKRFENIERAIKDLEKKRNSIGE